MIGGNIVIAELLYLESEDRKEIAIYINSPGGVTSGMAIYDTMNHEVSVSTICIGQAASMGAFLLAAVKRVAIRSYRIARSWCTSPSAAPRVRRATEIQAKKF